ncbi:MAG: hypothetical protein ABIM58_05780 [candidate division WOR-3 bacterium]
MWKSKNICEKCGKVIEEGGDFYEIEIICKAGFDGVIRETNESMEEILKDTELYTEDELLESVYEKKKFILCVRCKEIWMANPLQKPI